MDEEKDEGIDVDALDKTLEKLTQVVEKLTKGLEGFTAQASKSTKGNKVDHDKIHKQNMERQAEYFENVKAMKLLSAELKGGTSSIQMFSSLMTKGIGVSTVFEKLIKHTDGFITTNEKLRAAQEELAKLEEKYGSVGDKDGKGQDSRWADASKEDRSKAQDLKGKTEGKETDKLADQLGGAKEFFGKHKMGMMIGAGSAGILLKVLKMAFDASPMFQQIQKLLKFGIMMILRPIGDFFGFIMRPIMILLLRKFIIPWYTKMYPQMMKWGTEIGTKLAAALGALADGDVAGAFAALWGEVDWGTVIWNAIKAVIPILAVSDFIAGILGEGNGDGFNYMGREVRKWFDDGITAITPEWNKFWTETKKWFDDGIDGISDSWNKFWTGVYDWFTKGIGTISATFSDIWTSITTWFTNGITNTTVFWASIFYQIVGWFGAGLTTITESFNSIWNSVYNWIDEGLDEITNSWSSMFWVVYNWIKDGLAGVGTSFMNIGSLIYGAVENMLNLDMNGNGTIGMANGGQINEHIVGVGKSGQMYEFGEKGSETVTPNNGGGQQGITINIQSMSGSQQDLSNLKQTILDVMQEANTRRGRI
jgi:hypothetical protein